MKLQVKHCDRLKGNIKVSGSKNASLALMACCLLTNEEIVLENFPNILDTKNMLKILKEIGVKSKYNVFKKTLKCIWKTRIWNRKKWRVYKIQNIGY